MKLRISSIVEKGGPGSGFHGHKGRTGQVGGSSSSIGFQGTVNFSDEISSAGRAEFGGDISVNRTTYSNMSLADKKDLIAHEIAHHTIEDFILKDPEEWDKAIDTLAIQTNSKGRTLFAGGQTRIGEAIVTSAAVYLTGSSYPTLSKDKNNLIKSWVEGVIQRAGYSPNSIIHDIEDIISQLDSELYVMKQLQIKLKGGLGSGNFGHKGRPGEVGGSGSSTYSNIEINHFGKSGSGWRGSVQDGLNKVDERLLSAVHNNSDNGFSVETHDTIFDGLDVPNNDLWRSASGGYDPDRNTVIIPFKKYSRVEGEMVMNGLADKVVRHEFGHAVDHSIGLRNGIKWISDTAEYRNVWESEKNNYKIVEKTGYGHFANMDYFLNSKTGPMEFFAEAIAHLNGGAPTFGGKKMFEYFPKTLDIIQSMVEDYVSN